MSEGSRRRCVTDTELIQWLVRKGWKFDEIKKLTAYQIRNVLIPAYEQDEG